MSCAGSANLAAFALGNITGVTKISERHLVALEEERFDVLPGGVLSKGMVRGYARAVGLGRRCMGRAATSLPTTRAASSRTTM